MFTRRRWLASALSLLARPACGSRRISPDRAAKLSIPNPGKFGQKCLLLRPARVPQSEALPLLVLFHGLGETDSEALGIRAWYDRYGLPQAYARLSAPPVERTLPRERYLTDERLLELNRELVARALSPTWHWFVRSRPTCSSSIRARRFWIATRSTSSRRCCPRCARRRPSFRGVSTAAWPACRSAATSRSRCFCGNQRYLRRSAACRRRSAGPLPSTTRSVWPSSPARQARRAIQLVTSSFDPFRDATQRLAKHLSERAVSVTLTSPTGPHDQRFLREVATLEMLLFQARALHA